jgi:hypothetical protein
MPTPRFGKFFKPTRQAKWKPLGIESVAHKLKAQNIGAKIADEVPSSLDALFPRHFYGKTEIVLGGR